MIGYGTKSEYSWETEYRALQRAADASQACCPLPSTPRAVCLSMETTKEASPGVKMPGSFVSTCCQPKELQAATG